MRSESPSPKSKTGKSTNPVGVPLQPHVQQNATLRKAAGQRASYRRDNNTTAGGKQPIVPAGIPQVDRSKGEQSFSAYFNPPDSPDSPKTKPDEKSTQ
jgi:hypothetical protein